MATYFISKTDGTTFYIVKDDLLQITTKAFKQLVCDKENEKAAAAGKSERRTVDEINLTFAGKTLENDKIFDDYKLGDGSNIRCIFRKVPAATAASAAPASPSTAVPAAAAAVVRPPSP